MELGDKPKLTQSLHGNGAKEGREARPASSPSAAERGGGGGRDPPLRGPLRGLTGGPPAPPAPPAPPRPRLASRLSRPQSFHLGLLVTLRGPGARARRWRQGAWQGPGAGLRAVGVAMLHGTCAKARTGRGVAGLEAGLRGGAAQRRVRGLGAPGRKRRPAAPQLGGAGAREVMAATFFGEVVKAPCRAGTEDEEEDGEAGRETPEDREVRRQLARKR